MRGRRAHVIAVVAAAYGLDEDDLGFVLRGCTLAASSVSSIPAGSRQVATRSRLARKPLDLENPLI